MYYLLMKTLIRPQAILTIATSRGQLYKNKFNSNYAYAKVNKVNLFLLPAILSSLLFLLVPETPQNLSEICIKNYSEQVCDIF